MERTVPLEIAAPAGGYRAPNFTTRGGVPGGGIGRRLLTAGTLLLLVGFLVTIGLTAISLVSAWRHAAALREIARDNRDALAAPDAAARATRELIGLRDDLTNARAQLGPLGGVLGVAGGVEPLRALGTAPHLLDLGIALSAAGSEVALGVDPALQSGLGNRRAFVQALNAQQERFLRAERALAEAAAARARIDRAALAGPFAPAGRLLDDFDAHFGDLRDGLQGLRLLPRLFGADAPATYLLAAQNDEERRATGGFIGSLGLARIDSGDIQQLDFKNSYEYSSGREGLAPPGPLADLMGFGAWHIRDANWFPDFPTSAGWMTWFWTQYFGEAPDGVIVFDPEAFRELLKVTGPVEVSGLGPAGDQSETITADNYRDRALFWLYETQSGQRVFIQGTKTTFVRELGQAMLKRLLAMPPSELVRFAPALHRLLQEKHVLISLRDPDAAAILRERGWDGHVDRTTPDYLLVSDTTVSYTKLAPFVRESIDYSVDLTPDGGARATAVISYTNTYRPELIGDWYPKEYRCEFWNRFDERLDCLDGYYATYVRVYVPAGATLTAMTAGVSPVVQDSVVDEEGVDQEVQTGRRVFGRHLQIPQGVARTAQFSYTLPAGTWTPGQPYQLLVQKQPGGSAPLPLRVRVTAPPGYAIGSADGTTGPVATITTDLREDRLFTLDLVPAGSGGR